MYTLSPITCARLNRLPKLPAVWEGDRRPIANGLLSAFGYEGETEENESSDCIIWVDRTEGVLRAVSIVPADTGPEAIARTLFQAMENPQGAMPPARPQKLVVRDREIQFFLRGVLQDLELTVDHVGAVPLIDEIFDSLGHAQAPERPDLPPEWSNALNQLAQATWDTAPWNLLSDHHILSIKLDRWALDNLYVSILGMAGMEYGLLLYRSEASLKQFREQALLKGRTYQQMQQAFLSQDCLFLNFDLIEDEDAAPLLPLPWMKQAPAAVTPEYGSIHPLEGMRHHLELEEAAALRVGLEVLNRFFEKHSRALSKPKFPQLATTYDLKDPLDGSPIQVVVATETAITQQLDQLDQTAEADMEMPDLSGLFPTFRDDYIPEGSLILVSRVPVSLANRWQLASTKYVSPDPEPVPFEGEHVPAVIIQTSRPKAKTLTEQLKAAQGVQAVCFNPGRDPMAGEQFHLGLLQTGDGEFHLFVEFSASDPREQDIVARWHDWVKTLGDRCIVMVAGGVTGAARGRPSLREATVFFEAKAQSPEALKLPPLQMSYALDWEE
jgi:hypothetical protein